MYYNKTMHTWYLGRHPRTGGPAILCREHQFQGGPTSTSLVTHMTPREAALLVVSRLMTFRCEWAPGDLPPVSQTEAAEILSLEPDGRSSVIRLTLPAGADRPKVMILDIPGYDSILDTLATDVDKRGNFIRNTGIRNGFDSAVRAA